MPRFEVDIWMHVRHLMVVEANDAMEAQGLAIATLEGHAADEVRTEFTVERGVDGDNREGR